MKKKKIETNFRNEKLIAERSPETELFIVLDTETTTLPRLYDCAKTPEAKKQVCIGRPLIYDIAWQVIDKDRNVYSSHSYVITETFRQPDIMRSAYYIDKLPLYYDKLENGDIKEVLWEECKNELITDLNMCNMNLAFNCTFDFRKAFGFTEQYMTHLRSRDYHEWYDRQVWYVSEKMLKKNNKSDYKNPLDKATFKFYDKIYPMADLWGLACERIINIEEYKKFCLDNGFTSPSGQFFSTSAETVFAFLTKNKDYKEEHTALADVLIESEILYEILKVGNIPQGVIHFPFRLLGTTVENIYERYMETRKVNYKHIKLVHEKLIRSMLNTTSSAYTTKLEKMLGTLDWILSGDL